jgi:hypothetical protein
MGGFGKFAGYMAQNYPGAAIADIDARDQKRRFDQMEANTDRRRKEDKIYREGLAAKERAWRMEDWETTFTKQQEALTEQEKRQYGYTDDSGEYIPGYMDKMSERQSERSFEMQKKIHEWQTQYAIDKAPELAKAKSRADHAQAIEKITLETTAYYNTLEDTAGITLEDVIAENIATAYSSKGIKLDTKDLIGMMKTENERWDTMAQEKTKEYRKWVLDPRADKDPIKARALFLADAVTKQKGIMSALSGAGSVASQVDAQIAEKKTADALATISGATDNDYKIFLDAYGITDSPKAVEDFNEYLFDNNFLPKGAPKFKPGPVTPVGGAKSVLSSGDNYPSLDAPFDEPVEGISFTESQGNKYLLELKGQEHLGRQ